VPTRSYPQLTVRIRPEAKAELELVAAFEGRSQAEVIERALGAYVRELSPSSRKSLDGMRSHRANERS